MKRTGTKPISYILIAIMSTIIALNYSLVVLLGLSPFFQMGPLQSDLEMLLCNVGILLLVNPWIYFLLLSSEFLIVALVARFAQNAVPHRVLVLARQSIYIAFIGMLLCAFALAVLIVL